MSSTPISARWAALAVLVAGLLLPTSDAPAKAAKSPKTATFALIVGSNRSVDTELAPLRYADDDAVRFFELFQTLGAKATLLTRADANTRRVHPRAVTKAKAPTRRALSEALGALRRDIAKAKKAGRKTVLFFVYGGHGNIKRGKGYLTLEDARLEGKVLSAALKALGSDQSHLIIDACHSFFVAYSRGPGGSRRTLKKGFATRLFPEGAFGLLLSTSSAKESHEWGAIQAGVFSHEVRSGLYGAADVNADGLVTYREIGAFVRRANAAIPNERYRPTMFASPPKGEEVLLDLRSVSAARRITVGGAKSGRYWLEDLRGVRIADFHSGARETVKLLGRRDAAFYLREPAAKREYLIPKGGDVVVATLTPRKLSVESRGAAHHAFVKLFAYPFGRGAVADYRAQQVRALLLEGRLVLPGDRPSSTSWRSYLGWSLIGGGAAALAGGIAFNVAAQRNHDKAVGVLDQKERARINETIRAQNRNAAIFYVTAGAAVVGGLTALLWPKSKPKANERGQDDKENSDLSEESPFFTPTLQIQPSGGVIGLSGRF